MEAETVAKEWLNYIEAQEYAGIGRTKMWQLINADDIQAARVGRSVRISRASLESYMQRNIYTQTTG